MVICHIFVEIGHLYFLVEHSHKNLRKQIKIKIGAWKIFIFIRFLSFHLQITLLVPWAVYDCPLGWKRRKYNRSRVRKFHVPGLWSFVKFANQPIFIFISCLRFLWPCSTKIWQMTILHQIMTNDRAPPKFEKWPCSTKI